MSTNIPPLLDTAHPPVDPDYDNLTIRGKGDGDIYTDGVYRDVPLDIVVLQDLDIAKLLNEPRPF